MHAMKRQLALSLLLLILSLPTIAQNHAIAGQVVDETGAGISFATIARCNPSDSTVIGGLVADEMGRFTLDGVSLPSYASPHWDTKPPTDAWRAPPRHL